MTDSDKGLIERMAQALGEWDRECDSTRSEGARKLARVMIKAMKNDCLPSVHEAKIGDIEVTTVPIEPWEHVLKFLSRFSRENDLE